MYLEIDEGFPGHRKTLRFCSLMQSPEAAMFLVRLWTWACRSAPDGDLTGMEPYDVEIAVQYRPLDGRCYEAMVRAGFIDELEDGKRIHNWELRTGGAIRKMTERAEAIRAARAAKKTPCAGTVHAQIEHSDSTVQAQTAPRPVQSSPVQIKESLSARDPRSTEHRAPARTTGDQLRRAWGEERHAILGGLPWNAPADRQGHAETFAEQFSPEEVADVRPTMRRALEHIRDGHPDWGDSRLSRDPNFAFGAWKARFSALREELHGASPAVAAPQPRAALVAADAQAKAKIAADEKARRAVLETQRELERLHTCLFHRQLGNESRPSSDPYPTCPTCKRLGRKRPRDGDTEPIALGDLMHGGLR